MDKIYSEINQAEAEAVPSSGLVKLKLKIPQVPAKLQQPSFRLEVKFKRQVHYFFRVGWLGGWMGGVEEWRLNLS